MKTIQQQIDKLDRQLAVLDHKLDKLTNQQTKLFGKWKKLSQQVAKLPDDLRHGKIPAVTKVGSFKAR